MKVQAKLAVVVAAVVLAGSWAMASHVLAQTDIRAGAAIHHPQIDRPETNPAQHAMDADRKAQLKLIDDKIATLREQFKSQADPLETQIKSMRDKFDADLQSLQDQRRAIIEQGESPELKSIDDDEVAQMATLTAREKAEVEKLRAHYNDERNQLRQTFQQRRRDLMREKR